jgi:HCOMODA/2-hydroxy-3-carboxy-muconic semialdehyde decarboxylase
MRGQGFTVVGGSLKEAVYNTVNTIASARIQLDAMHLGNVTYLSGGEAVATAKIHITVPDRNWDVWAQRAIGQLP